MPHLSNAADVLIVGGGPAGLAAAIALRQAGLEVAVADGAGPAIDKVCGEGLMPRAIAALRTLGVTFPVGLGRAFDGLRFCMPGTTARAAFSGALGLGLRRTDLHHLLREHAQAAGALLLWNSPVRLQPDGTPQVAGEPWRVRWIIGADGQRSAIRHAAGLEPRKALRACDQRLGFRQHYRCAPWSRDVEIYWADGVQAYVTPVAEDQVCVAMVAAGKQWRLSALPQLFPELAQKLVRAQPISGERGAATISRHIPRLMRGSVVLIGDAAGSVDAITGHGLSIALEQAVALGAAFAAGRPERYARQAIALQQASRCMSRALTFLGRHPRLCQRIIAASARETALFAQMAAWHAGTRSVEPVRAGTLARLGWHLVSA